MKKFVKLIFQTAFILSALYIAASIGAEAFDWIMADMLRTIACFTFSFYIICRWVYKELI